MSIKTGGDYKNMEKQKLAGFTLRYRSAKIGGFLNIIFEFICVLFSEKK